MLMVLPVRVLAEDYQFATNGNAITITKYIGAGEVVTIPEKINGLAVTSIGDWAFHRCSSASMDDMDKLGLYVETDDGKDELINCTNLTSVIIPNTIKTIGVGAFYSCTDLINVAIPNSVTNIGVYAFKDCTSLQSISIPNSVTTIDDLAFWSSTNLTSVYFQGTPPDVGVLVFGMDNNATIYYLPETKGWHKTFGGRPTAVWKQ